VLRYVLGTIGYGIEYGGKQPGHGVKKILAHSDSDFAAASNPSAKSISGYVVFINGGAVSWRSKLQSLTALSTAEAEYVALCKAAREVKFLADVVQFLGLSHSFGAPIIMGDNEAAHKIANNPAFHSRTKHFDVKVHFVRKLVARKEIVLHRVAAADNAADVSTKQSDQKQFAESICQLLIVDRRASAPEA
jgi:KUP system potassium uptake protein